MYSDIEARVQIPAPPPFTRNNFNSLQILIPQKYRHQTVTRIDSHNQTQSDVKRQLCTLPSSGNQFRKCKSVVTRLTSPMILIDRYFSFQYTPH